MQDQSLKTNFNALVSTNSMNYKLFGPALRSNTSYTRDAYLQTFIALDYYYSKMFDLDFSKINLEFNDTKQEANNKIDFNKTPLNLPKKNNTRKVDDHAGHNH